MAEKIDRRIVIAGAVMAVLVIGGLLWILSVTAWSPWPRRARERLDCRGYPSGLHIAPPSIPGRPC